MLKVLGLRVKIEDKEILKGVNLKIEPGEVVAIMGPNGSGKSTLAYSLAGNSQYRVVEGKVSLEGKNLLKMSPNERAKLGLFLGFQNPTAIKGVSVEKLLRAAVLSCRKELCVDKGKDCLTVTEFREYLEKQATKLKIDKKFLKRGVNEGFSGGEKKKMEVLQLMVLKPKLAVLDETDSGLDIDALKIVAEGINRVKKENKEMSVLMITHYQRILKYIKPDRVLVMKEGKIVKEGGRELVKTLEKEGYEKFK